MICDSTVMPIDIAYLMTSVTACITAIVCIGIGYTLSQVMGQYRR